MKWKPEITRSEFESAYCARSNLTLTQFRMRKVALPCLCDDSGCQGWAAITYENVLDHMAMNTPTYRQLMAQYEREISEGKNR